VSDELAWLAWCAARLEAVRVKETAVVHEMRAAVVAAYRSGVTVNELAVRANTDCGTIMRWVREGTA